MFVDSLLGMSVDELARVCQDPMGSRTVEAFFMSKTVKEKKKNKFCDKIKVMRKLDYLLTKEKIFFNSPTCAVTVQHAKVSPHLMYQHLWTSFLVPNGLLSASFALKCWLNEQVSVHRSMQID